MVLSSKIRWNNAIYIYTYRLMYSFPEPRPGMAGHVQALQARRIMWVGCLSSSGAGWLWCDQLIGCRPETWIKLIAPPKLSQREKSWSGQVYPRDLSFRTTHHHPKNSAFLRSKQISCLGSRLPVVSAFSLQTLGASFNDWSPNTTCQPLGEVKEAMRTTA